MEKKVTEAEKCNGWLRKMGAFAYCVFECDGDFPNDYEMFDYYIEKVKEHDGPLVSKYLKSLESNDTKQRKEAILEIICHFDMVYFKNDNYRWDYESVIKKRRKNYCNMRCRYKNIRIEDPRMFWFRKLVEEDISEIEICRMLLTCQELGEYEIGISLGQEYVKKNEIHLISELSNTLVNKHIEVLQEKLRARIEYEDREDMENMNSMSISDYRDSLRELEEDSWEAMTGGMYGDYDGDVDMEKLGY